MKNSRNKIRQAVENDIALGLINHDHHWTKGRVLRYIDRSIHHHQFISEYSEALLIYQAAIAEFGFDYHNMPSLTNQEVNDVICHVKDNELIDDTMSARQRFNMLIDVAHDYIEMSVE